ncbi:MAG: hypothetical protein AAGU32_22225 [Bacillota bacterium]
MTRATGFPKGHPLAHDFAKQSVVCDTLCQRCRKNTIAAGEAKGIFAEKWVRICGGKAANDGLISAADRAYMEPRLSSRRDCLLVAV